MASAGSLTTTSNALLQACQIPGGCPVCSWACALQPGTLCSLATCSHDTGISCLSRAFLVRAGGERSPTQRSGVVFPPGKAASIHSSGWKGPCTPRVTVLRFLAHSYDVITPLLWLLVCGWHPCCPPSAWPSCWKGKKNKGSLTVLSLAVCLDSIWLADLTWKAVFTWEPPWCRSHPSPRQALSSLGSGEGVLAY